MSRGGRATSLLRRARLGGRRSGCVWSGIAATARQLPTVLAVGDRFHLDGPGLWHRRLRDADLEKPVLDICLDLVDLDAFRQLEAAGKRAITALDEVIASLILPLFAAIAANGEDAVLGRHVHVVRVTSRDLDGEAQLPIGLANVDERCPLSLLGLALRDGALEESVKLALEAECGCRHGWRVKHGASCVARALPSISLDSRALMAPRFLTVV